MSRVWLVLAMAVSLWPAAWLSVSIATDSASDSAVSTQAADDTQPTPGDDASGGADDAGAPQEADLDSYMALRDRTDALIDDLDRSHVLRGVSKRRLSDRAASLADDYAAGTSGTASSTTTFIGSREPSAIALRASPLAAAPSQAAFDRFNAAVRRFNSTLRDVQG